jgi:DNA-binding CsgD family transcriptional regulator
MGDQKEKLCILTPDNFYGVLLREATFPTFDVRVIKSASELQSLAVNFWPEAFLLFSEHLGSSVLARTLLEIRRKFPKVSVFQIEGVREPRLQLLWSASSNGIQAPSTSVSNVDELDGAICAMISGETASERIRPLTATQLQVLQRLAGGSTNAEIAEERGTSIRSIEAILKRALSRISPDVPKSPRTRMVLAQAYLAKRHDFSVVEEL